MCQIYAISNFVFFLNDTATTEIYTLSLHDALPISALWAAGGVERTDDLPLFHIGATAASLGDDGPLLPEPEPDLPPQRGDRKSTRLNSSHANISYAVFCLKKKKTESRLDIRYRLLQ